MNVPSKYLVFWSFCSHKDPTKIINYGLPDKEELQLTRFVYSESGHQASEGILIQHDDKDFLELLELFFETRFNKIKKELTR